MKNEDIIRMVNEIFYASDKNTVHLPEENIDIPILEEPLIGFAAADDPLFDLYKSDPSIIGETLLTP